MQDGKQFEHIQKLIPLLQRHEAFRTLSGEEVGELASRAEIKFRARDIELTRQGEADGRFFVVIDGQLRSVDYQVTPPRLLNHHPPGDVVGTRALLGDDVRLRAATVEAETDSYVAIYSKDDWDWLVNRHPEVVEHFRNLERGFEQRAGTSFPGRQPDEVVVARSKRHIIAFIARLAGPLILLIFALMMVIADELFGVTFVSAFTDNLVLTLIGIILPIVAALLWAGYLYLDWLNDDFIVSSKRVIHIERVLWIRTERHEAPLTRIQNVTVKSHGLLDELVGSRDIEIKTAGAGVIAFSELPNAYAFSETILQEQARARARVSAADTASLRRTLRERLQTGPAATFTPPPAKPIVRPMVPVVPKFRLSYFVPRIRETRTMMFGGKSESAVLWRKHYFVLLRHAILPILVFLFLTYITAATLVGIPVFGIFTLGWVTALASFLGMLGSFFWVLWEYDDWRQDIYIVTESRIIDVESSAFRLTGQTQREGNFDSVQNIYYKIPNFFYNLINLGDVIIETAAGATKNFTFVQVYNPSGVQEAIFDRWETFQRRKEEKQRGEVDKRIVTALEEYHDGDY